MVKIKWMWDELHTINDTVIENTNENIIDSILEYYEYIDKI